MPCAYEDKEWSASEASLYRIDQHRHLLHKLMQYDGRDGRHLRGGAAAQLVTSLMFNRRPNGAPKVVTDGDRLGWSGMVSHRSARVDGASMQWIPEENGDVSQLRRADARIGAEDVGEDPVDRGPVLYAKILPEEPTVAGFPGRVGELQRLVEGGDDQLFTIIGVVALETVDCPRAQVRRHGAFIAGSASIVSRVRLRGQDWG